VIIPEATAVMGVKKHHLRSATFGGHVNGGELSINKVDPFWKKAEELPAWFSCTRRAFQK
jgi:hypothetical protein